MALAVLESSRRFFHMWRNVLTETIPLTRQRLDLPALASPTLPKRNNKNCFEGCNSSGNGSTSSCRPSSSAILDAATTSKLRDGCAYRGMSLDSVLLAALSLAVAEAVRLERFGPCVGAEGGGGTISENSKPFRARAQRALVFGFVCVAMSLLSGSIDSKVLRYFCSIYGVISGAILVAYLCPHRPC